MGDKLTLAFMQHWPMRASGGICIRRFITHHHSRIRCEVFSLLADMWKVGQRMRKWGLLSGGSLLTREQAVLLQKTVPFCWHCMRWQIWGFIMMVESMDTVKFSKNELEVWEIVNQIL